MTEQIVGALTVQMATYHLRLNVKHRHGDLINSITIQSDRATAMQVGERVSIGGLEGFPESRHTRGVVRRVSHTFTGGALDFVHTVLVDIDEDEV
jgi:hypothetical protein